MLPELNDYLFSEWNTLFPEVPKPRSLNYLGIAGSIEGGTTTFLAFIEREIKPAFVVKIHRYPDAQDKVFNESQTLNFLLANAGLLADSVPRLIACKKFSGVWMLVQTVIEGHPLMAAMDNNGLPEIGSAVKNIELSIDWLTKLHSIIQPDSSFEVSQQLKKDQIKNIDLCLRTFDLSKSDKDFLRELADNLDSLLTVGAFIQHGDFCRHNVLLGGNHGRTKIGVIDWTDSKRYGFPLHDIFFFLTTYYLQTRKRIGIKGFIQAFEDTYLSENRYGDVIKKTLLDYCTQFKIDFSNIKLLFGAFLINQALFEYKKLIRCSNFGGLPRFSVYLGLSTNKGYPEVLKEQLWIYFFRTFVRNQDHYIIT